MTHEPQAVNHCIKRDRGMEATSWRLRDVPRGRIRPPQCPFSGQNAELLTAACQ